MGNPTQLNP